MVHDELIGPEFNDTNAVGVFDKAFTSIRLFRALYARGIRAIGMIKAKKPKSTPRGASHYWPLPNLAKDEVEDLEPGWLRRAYTPVGDGWICAEAWRDNRLVTMISTAYSSELLEKVRRWSRAAGEKETRPCSIPLKKYTVFMGGVDRFNAQLARCNLRMLHCPRRYHRNLFFGWHLAGVGVCNVRTQFNALYPEVAELQKEKENTIGYSWWFQDALGRAVRDHGWALMMEGEEVYDSPHCAPNRAKRPRPSPPPPTAPSDHGELWRATDVCCGWDDNRNEVYMATKGWCALCSAVASNAGTLKRGSQKMPSGKWVPKPVWACSTCKVYLCDDCNAPYHEWKAGKKLEECCSPEV